MVDEHGDARMAVMPLPKNITFDVVAALADADEFHRYELAADGALVVTGPPTLEHQRIISQLIGWFARHGYGAGEIYTAVGVFTGGARQPDFTVWRGDAAVPVRSDYCGTDGLLLIIEIVAPSSAFEDKIRKREEYARAGIPRYWIIEQDQPQTVVMLALDAEKGEYVSVAPSPQPLQWLFTTNPAEYLGRRD